MAYKLIIGNKNYSSWSLRAWLLLKQAGIAFEEQPISLLDQNFKPTVLQHSPAGKVPVLVDGAVNVWDSLAICEYIAERHPELKLWPQAAGERAMARSICAEMHSGFMSLRNLMPMNCRKRFPGKGHTPEVMQDIVRILSIWQDCRGRFKQAGPFLFGHFTIADAFYAPVALRFRTYAVDLPADAKAYAETILALPVMQEWLAAAEVEGQTIDRFEPYS
ncbi:MAG TPA: glutathione S-transferase family protein [Methylophilaceae bacterium]|jgi:glutathione S-transferase